MTIRVTVFRLFYIIFKDMLTALSPRLAAIRFCK